MCGIAGVLDPTGSLSSEALQHTARAMGQALAHRGPDDHGTWVDDRVGIALAHRRLSVIDLSTEGHQPMVSASGRYVITYNGEIYNYAAVRHDLEAIGAAPVWRGHSDTEVMLAAVERWGMADALQRFNGMFAFALWDRQERVLHLARDRMGEKPLYYGVMGRRFAFGSELSAMRAAPSFRGEVDRDALALLLRYNYVPAPWSIYRDVRKLCPGARAEIRVDGAGLPAIHTFAYWSVAEAARRGIAAAGRCDEREAADLVRAELDRSVRLRMVADVPIGAFLSGGIDSTLVTATMQRLSSQRVRTFTIGFDDGEYDE
ncbi:MAG TPA: asparagine synthase (glutamine-hydrolyzing), partial [Candidatus Tumulicola sp.]|nr:asparagine synthase (glutamine-hydrolyzing) [Candidatus Tumulicola sp.]